MNFFMVCTTSKREKLRLEKNILEIFRRIHVSVCLLFLNISHGKNRSFSDHDEKQCNECIISDLDSYKRRHTPTIAIRYKRLETSYSVLLPFVIFLLS